MKCQNCGAEVDGRFCTNCGTPVPQEQPVAEQTTNAQQTEQQPVQPVDYTAPTDNQQNAPYTEQKASTSYGQQFTNQTNGNYAGQQFTNQPAGNTPVKKGMSGGKIAILVVSIVLGVMILFGVIIGVAACSFINSNKSAIEKAASDFVDEYGSDGEFSYNYHYDFNSFDGTDGDLSTLSVGSDSYAFC